MPHLTIVCDLDFEPRIKRLLVKRTGPHRCLFVSPEQSGDLADRKAGAAFARQLLR